MCAPLELVGGLRLAAAARKLARRAGARDEKQLAQVDRVVASLRKYLRFERFEIALALAVLAARDARATFDDAAGGGDDDDEADPGELFVGVAPDDEVCRVGRRAPITVRVRSTLHDVVNDVEKLITAGMKEFARQQEVSDAEPFDGPSSEA